MAKEILEILWMQREAAEIARSPMAEGMIDTAIAQTRFLKEKGALDESIYTPQEEIAKADLRTLVAKQIDKLVKNNRNLGFTERGYRRSLSLPKDAKQPEGYKGRSDIPLIIDPRVNYYRTLSPFVSILDNNVDPVQNTTEAPTRPYLVWVSRIPFRSDQSPKQASETFPSDQVGCTLLEVANFWLQYPQLFAGRTIAAAGSIRQDGTVPYMYPGSINVKIRQQRADYLDPMMHSLSRGREITLLGPHRK